MFTGRAVQPGEPLFLPEDTAGAIALAEEERDTCPSCGYPKAWCRDPDPKKGMARFDAHEERCWATDRLARRREQMDKEKHGATRQAIQLTPRFRKGHEPDIAAGLDIDLDGGGLG